MFHVGNSTNGTRHSVQYQNVLVGTLLAIGGNLLISVALNIQKYVHMRVGPEATSWLYVRTPLWWLGVSVMVVGEIGNFTAYGFAPASMVAPLGTTTVIVNMVIAVVCLRERLRPEDLIGSALAVIGTFLIILFSDHKEPILDGDQLLKQMENPAFIAYIVIETVFLVGLFILLLVFKRDAVVVVLLIVAIIGSFTVISAKAVSGLIQLSVAGRPQWSEPILYIMAAVLVVTAALQVIYLNKAMRTNFSTVVVPTTFVFFTISAIIGGIVMYDEFENLERLEIFMFLIGCVLAFAGVYLIQLNREVTDELSETSPLSRKDGTESGDAPSRPATAASTASSPFPSAEK